MGLRQTTLEGVGLDTAFWKDRRVLVTGHTGFKGAWLSLWLQQLGARTTGLALPPPTDPNLYESALVGAGMDSHIGDIRDFDFVSRTLRACEPEVLIHMAAQSLVGRSYQDRIGTYSTNVMGTVHVLEAARTCPSVLATLIVTSDKVYRNKESAMGYREEDELGGTDAYSASKACAELATSAYRESGGDGNQIQRIATARAGNVIGGGDWSEDRLVPDLVRAYSKGQEATLRRPDASRPWQYVLDPLCGYLLLCERLCKAESDEYSHAWNFGPGTAGNATVSSIAERVAEKWGKDASWRNLDKDAYKETGTLAVNATRARSEMGWTPRLSLQEALDWTIEWYQAYFADDDMPRFTGRQIDRYAALM